MNVTEDYLRRAETILTGVFKSNRDKLNEALGHAPHTLKDDNTVVTKFDVELENEISSILKKFDPGVGVIGEEAGGQTRAETFWLIDPIDGTESFTRGLPLPRNIATLVSNREPIYTLIYKFVTDEIFSATLNKGAYRNGKRIHVSDRPLNHAWLDYSLNLKSNALINKYITLKKNVKEIVSLKDFVRFANGGIDAVIIDSGFGGDWDYAPRGLLYKEAGALISNCGCDDYDYRKKSLIAAGESSYYRIKELYEEDN